MTNEPYFREPMVWRLRQMLSERGIPHIVYRSTFRDHEAASIVAYTTDEVGGVTEVRMTPKSLLADQEWMELPIICPSPDL